MDHVANALTVLPWRRLLFLHHACVGTYSDDGEMQCSRYLPPIDFLRDTADEIERKCWAHTRGRIEDANAAKRKDDEDDDGA